AKAAGEKDGRGLSQVRKEVLNRFKDKGVHEFMLFYSRKADSFGAYIFYERDSQINEAVENGLAAEIESSIYEGLENVGRGAQESISVKFEFDSHENVVRNYESDYYNRLR
ncbi:hypothetical protein, partial [Pseudoalteromonas sp. GABNS16H]